MFKYNIQKYQIPNFPKFIIFKYMEVLTTIKFVEITNSQSIV